MDFDNDDFQIELFFKMQGLKNIRQIENGRDTHPYSGNPSKVSCSSHLSHSQLLQPSFVSKVRNNTQLKLGSS